MKKILVAILSVLMILSFCAFKNSDALFHVTVTAVNNSEDDEEYSSSIKAGSKIFCHYSVLSNDVPNADTTVYVTFTFPDGYVWEGETDGPVDNSYTGWFWVTHPDSPNGTLKIEFFDESGNQIGSESVELGGSTKKTDNTVKTESVSEADLVGYWSSRNGMHTFEMKENGSYITTVPVVPRCGDTYMMIDGVIYSFYQNNPNNITANLKITKISNTEIEVYSYQTDTTYTLMKRR